MATLTVGYAYSPRQTATPIGAYHLVTLERLEAGRITRDAGDALCKPARRFWGLERHPSFEKNGADCKRCREIAARLNLSLLTSAQPGA